MTEETGKPKRSFCDYVIIAAVTVAIVGYVVGLVCFCMTAINCILTLAAVNFINPWVGPLTVVALIGFLTRSDLGHQ